MGRSVVFAAVESWSQMVCNLFPKEMWRERDSRRMCALEHLKGVPRRFDPVTRGAFVQEIALLCDQPVAVFARTNRLLTHCRPTADGPSPVLRRLQSKIRLVGRQSLLQSAFVDAIQPEPPPPKPAEVIQQKAATRSFLFKTVARIKAKRLEAAARQAKEKPKKVGRQVNTAFVCKFCRSSQPGDVNFCRDCLKIRDGFQLHPAEQRKYDVYVAEQDEVSKTPSLLVVVPVGQGKQVTRSLQIRSTAGHSLRFTIPNVEDPAPHMEQFQDGHRIGFVLGVRFAPTLCQVEDTCVASYSTDPGSLMQPVKGTFDVPKHEARAKMLQLAELCMLSHTPCELEKGDLPAGWLPADAYPLQGKQPPKVVAKPKRKIADPSVARWSVVSAMSQAVNTVRRASVADEDVALFFHD